MLKGTQAVIREGAPASQERIDPARAGPPKQVSHHIRVPKSRQQAKDAWSRTFNLDGGQRARPIVLVGKQMNHSVQRTQRDAARHTSRMTNSNDGRPHASGATSQEEVGDNKNSSSSPNDDKTNGDGMQHLTAQKVSVHQNTITNSDNYTNQDLNGMELNEIPVHEASDLKDGVDVKSAFQERVSP